MATLAFRNGLQMNVVTNQETMSKEHKRKCRTSGIKKKCKSQRNIFQKRVQCDRVGRELQIYRTLTFIEGLLLARPMPAALSIDVH